jgi:hypothetical protein
MKRRGYIAEQVADVDNLRMAFWKAQRGRSSKPEVARLRETLDPCLRRLREQLLDGSRSFGPYRYFTVYDPKQRVICAAPFEDRVAHHAIMNVCAPDFEGRQLPYSYACRKGKGTFAAVEQAAAYQRRFAWYLKLDVRKYFNSIDHQLLFAMVQRMYKDQRLLNLLWKIIDSYHASDGVGVPIGNLTSQYFANHYLALADRHAVVDLRVPAYVRYMDDMFLWANDRSELLEKGAQLAAFIADRLRLRLKPFVCNKVQHGLPALGFLLFPDRVRLNRRSRDRFRAKLREDYRLLRRGEIDQGEFGRKVLACYGFISHADSRGFARSAVRREGACMESAAQGLGAACARCQKTCTWRG